VTVRYRDAAVELEIADGTARADGTAHGLVGMRERAAIFGGELETAEADGGGFTVRARLPLMASA
jgi:signal transduction histidine kinase